jgi:hypothetical protein
MIYETQNNNNLALPAPVDIAVFRVEAIATDAGQVLIVNLERERCQVRPKDASWPRHSCGNKAAAIKG